jgi:hypothetical protein
MPEDTEKVEFDDPKTWHGRISLAQRYLEEHGNTDGRWDKNVKALAGDFNSKAELGDEAIDVNMMRTNAKTTLAPLWVTPPHITVRPTKAKTNKGGDNVRNAEITELEINYWLRELQIKNQIRKVAIDGHATNHGYVYLGYVSDKSDVESKDGERTENDPAVKFKQPFAKRHSPKRVLVPPGYDDLESCPWVDLVFLKPLRHVKDKYGARADDVQASVTFEDAAKTGDSGDFNEYLKSDDAQLVEIHNIWDKESKKVYVLAKDNEDFLEDPKAWPVDVEGFPLEHYRPEDIPDEYWGTPPMTYSLPQNKELNAARTALRKRMNRTKATIIIDKDQEQEFTEKYAQADDGVIIGIDPGDLGVARQIHIDNGLPLDAAGIQYGLVAERDLMQIDGMSAEQRGSGDPNVDSATASANIEKNVQIRNSDKGDRVRDLWVGIARKLWMILKAHPNEKRSRRIAGDVAGQFATVEYSLKELEGEFEFDMDFSAMLADNPATRQTQSVLNYNLLRADPLVNPTMLLLDIFKTQNKVKPENYLLQLRQPGEELQLMMQGLPVEAHDRDDHQSHIQEHEQQAEQLDQGLRQMPPDHDMRGKVALAQSLMVAHVQDHMKRLQAITGQEKPPGSPVAENMLRNQVRAGSGETEAELSGQPLNQADLVN